MLIYSLLDTLWWNEMSFEFANSCFLCINPADSTCDTCSVPICSENHAKIHRSKEGLCRPFRVRYRQGVGKYLVATRNISALEIILEEKPAAFGPDHDTKPVCLECHSLISPNENAEGL